MKTASRIFVSIVFLVCAFSVNAQAAEEDFFVTKWKVLVEGTPSGDATLYVDLKKNEEGKVVGKILQEGKPESEITRVEIKDETLTVYWVASGYDVYLFLEKVDEKNTEGTMMDMFDAYGERVVKKQ